MMGYTCLTCGLWVDPGSIHYCGFPQRQPPLQQQYFSPVPYSVHDPLILAELQKITALLEQLVKEKSAA
jgi:hypothetical protein